MLKRNPARLVNAACLVALVVLVALLPAAPATAQGAPSAIATTEDQIPSPALLQATQSSGQLQLEVLINDQPTQKIIGFTDLGGGRFAAMRRELEEIGIRAPGGGAPEQLIELSMIANLSYRYDAPAQRIEISVSDGSRIRKVYDAKDTIGERDAARADYGAVLNYSIFAAGNAETSKLDVPDFSGVNSSLDGRVFTPFGVLSQTGIVGQTVGSALGETEAGALRLDTTLTYADEDDMVNYRAGDVYSYGPAWSRPVRLGGVQAQRSFQMRPDLVIQSLPSFSGSAAVPSTVDVYVNNARAYSKDVAAGPYQIDNLPVLNGAGSARVVVRDAAGRETEQTLPFYSSPELLRPGLIDFSVETGFARRDFGLRSSDYDDDLIGSGSIKTGVFEDLTVETHAEAGAGLINVGGGVVLRAGDFGVVSAAVSGSSKDSRTGYQLYGSFDTKVGPIMINGRSQRAFDGYEDLASVTGGQGSVGLPGLFTAGGRLSIAPPKAVDSIGVSVPLDFDESSIGVNLIHYEAADGDVSNLVTATYSRPLIEKATLVATGYVDLDNTNTAALYVGVNMPLGDNVSISSSVNQRAGKTTAGVDASKALQQSAESWGWHVRDYEGQNSYRAAEVAYRASSARISGGVRQDRDRLRGSVEVDGAIATLGGGIYTSNRIDDSFAVVDAGAPGVRVTRQNNFVGETDEDGTIMVPNLNSYQKNKIAIDPMGLPLNAEVGDSHTNITPAFRSGIYVDFKVKRNVPSALVILKGATGEFLTAGSEVTLEGSTEPFMVGYDGQTYVTGLGANNTLSVKVGGSVCHVSFAFSPQSDRQQVIGPEVCQ